LLLSALAASAGWLVLRWLPPGACAMVAAIVAAIIVYLTGAVLGRHPALADLRELWRALRTGAAPRPAAGDEGRA
jgi:hypothetical protein